MRPYYFRVIQHIVLSILLKKIQNNIVNTGFMCNLRIFSVLYITTEFDFIKNVIPSKIVYEQVRLEISRMLVGVYQ